MIVRDAAELDALAGEWNALLDDSAQSAFTLRPFWMLAWWRQFAPPGARLHVIACRGGGGALIGLAPLYFDPDARELRFIGVSTDHDLPANLSAAIVARRGSEAAAVNAVADALVGDGEWSRLWLARLRPEHETTRLAIAALRGTAAENDARNVSVPIRGDWESYRQSLGKAGRKRVQRYARRALERGFVFRRAGACGEVESALARYLSWHAGRFESEGVYARAAAEAFLREVVVRGFGEGRARVWIAEHEGQIAAVDIAFVDRGAVTAFQGHVDPAHAALRLGHVMTANFLCDSFGDPAVEVVDLGRAAPHKETWSDETWGTIDFICSRATA